MPVGSLLRKMGLETPARVLTVGLILGPASSTVPLLLGFRSLRDHQGHRDCKQELGGTWADMAGPAWPPF